MFRQVMISSVLCGAVAVAAALPYSRAEAGQGYGQAAKPDKQAEAANPTVPATKIPLRVLLVISDAVRQYEKGNPAWSNNFGPHITEDSDKLFSDTFISSRLVTEVPGGPQPPADTDLIVHIESPNSQIHAFFMSFNLTLTLDFRVCEANGQEIFHVQETDTQHGVGNAPTVAKRLSDSVPRKFIQDLLLNARVREMIASPPGAGANAEGENSAMQGTAGLDEPPPAPWVEAGPESPAELPAEIGRP